MRKIEINQIPEILDAQPKEMSVLIIGDTGIGKTQVIKKYAEDNNIYLKTLILSQIEASEALGIPVQSKRIYNGREYSTIETAVPTWVFDLAEHENAMLYLDEFLCAEPAVMNSFLNFITEKRVGDIDLSHVKIVAATNIGNYTYDPDNNILSRFCMFYAVNTKFNTYLKNKFGSKRLENDYTDEEDLSGIIFDKRSLKPRCQEMLYLLKDDTMLDMFYEGYTNTPRMPKFHSKKAINDIVKGFVIKNEYSDTWSIKDEDLSALAGFLYKETYKSKNVEKIIMDVTEYKNVSYRISPLREKLRELFSNIY